MLENIINVRFILRLISVEVEEFYIIWIIGFLGNLRGNFLIGRRVLILLLFLFFGFDFCIGFGGINKVFFLRDCYRCFFFFWLSKGIFFFVGSLRKLNIDL